MLQGGFKPRNASFAYLGINPYILVVLVKARITTLGGEPVLPGFLMSPNFPQTFVILSYNISICAPEKERRMTPQSLELSGIGKGFGADDVLKEIDLSIRPGEFLSRVSISGCGKSTLLRIIAGLETPVRGSV